MSTFSCTVENSLIEGTNTQTYPTIDFDDASIGKNSVKDINVAAGATDTEISLDGLTAKHLRLTASATFSVKLNGTGNTALTLTPSANNPAMLLLAGCAVTSVHVSNPGGLPIEMKLIAMAE